MAVKDVALCKDPSGESGSFVSSPVVGHDMDMFLRPSCMSLVFHVKYVQGIGLS